jgi:hypothetical protein
MEPDLDGKRSLAWSSRFAAYVPRRRTIRLAVPTEVNAILVLQPLHIVPSKEVKRPQSKTQDAEPQG